MTEKTLPEIYREAADLIETDGKGEGDYGRKGCGFCTMGAVLFAAGHEENGIPDLNICTEEFGRLMKPVADRLVATHRTPAVEQNVYGVENEVFFKTVYQWNDGYTTADEPTKEEVAALLRETADAEEASA